MTTANQDNTQNSPLENDASLALQGDQLKSAQILKERLTDGVDVQFNPKNSFGRNIGEAWHALTNSIKHGYINTADSLVDEVLLRLTAKQINDALYQFVTKNLAMIHELRMELHDNWLRLYAVVDVKGIFASVACNFRLVQMDISSHNQRFVFEQLSDTEILELHSRTWWHASLAKFAIKAYRKLLKKDLLPFLLNKINAKGEPFAVYKDEFIYLDIHRYLTKQTKMLNYLKKAQINDGYTLQDKLLLKVQINFAELISFGESGEDIITEKDNPDRK